MRAAAIALVCLACAASAYWVGDGYIDRLPNHDGYFLVDVEVPPPGGLGGERLPARVIVIVIDGLRQDAARTMKSVTELEGHGLCTSMNNGKLTVSRPVYSVLSSGAEADRTGSRNNDNRSKVAVDSIWESARRSGRTVRGISDTRFWVELFPDGFDDYRYESDHGIDFFHAIGLADLTLIHPGYVDKAGHDHGADSVAYRRAVERLDGEVLAFLETLDFTRDLVLFTSDHGHTDSGGHGGITPEIADVLTCVAGRGALAKASSTIDARIVAPVLAVALGVGFPRHMRAGDDSLSTLWSLLDPVQLGRPYAEQRDQEIEVFRAANRKRTSQWLGHDGGWDELYDRERASQLRRGATILFALVVLLGLATRRRGWKAGLSGLGWLVVTLAVTCAIYTVARGSFDFSSINRRVPFLQVGLLITVIVGALSAGLHYVLWRDLGRLLADQLLLLGSLTLITVSHHYVYGDPLGFPLPGPIELFVPFIGSVLVIGHAGLTLATLFLRLVVARRL